MNQKPSFSPFLTSAITVLVSLALLFSSGCRNCNQACGGNGFAHSPTIAPPPTYSLQIPSANGNPAYYVPGSPNPNATANLPSYLVDPNRRAPVPTGNTGTPNINQQNGWRPTGNNNLSNTGSTASSTTLAQNPNATGIAPPTRLASAPTARSVVSSVDYTSTRSNEQLDPTRLPATDASNVQAPAAFTNNGSATRLAQALPAQYPNTYNQAAAFNQPAPAVYNGTPVIAQQPAQPFYYGTPTVRQSAPTVLAQATATATGIPSTGSAGWTDRELTASRNELNR